MIYRQVPQSDRVLALSDVVINIYKRSIGDEVQWLSSFMPKEWDGQDD